MDPLQIIQSRIQKLIASRKQFLLHDVEDHLEDISNDFGNQELTTSIRATH